MEHYQPGVRPHHTGRHRYEIDMCNGPLAGKILRFAVPYFLTAWVNFLFSAADMMVIGRFTDGHTALAGICAAGPFFNLLVSLTMGLSVGTNVVIANYIGAGMRREVVRAAHTSITFALIAGSVLAVIGFSTIGFLLEYMHVPADVLPKTKIYLKIVFCGLPSSMFYTFGAGILRASGDTKRPFWFLSCAGFVNLLLNLLFVIVFKMETAGVALATVLSKLGATTAMAITLTRTRADYRIFWSKLHIDWTTMKKILYIGLPAGFQSSCAGFSHLILQTALNSMGSIAIAGFASAAQISHFVSAMTSCFSTTAVTFVGQNYGAVKFDRIKRVIGLCIAFSTAGCILLCSTFIFWPERLLYIFTRDSRVVECGIMCLQYYAGFFFLSGILNTFSGVLRGMKMAFLPAVVTVFNTCVIRLILVWTVFPIPRFHTVKFLMQTYPITWIVGSIVNGLLLLIFWNSCKRRRLEMAL